MTILTWNLRNPSFFFYKFYLIFSVHKYGLGMHLT